VGPCYRDADVFVTASTRENHPLTVLEAMASGLPVVAPAAGGMPAMIDDGRDGSLVPPDDAAALARAVSRLADDPAALARMGHAARDRALGATWEAATQNMINVWEGLRRR
jgi:glycosyltransferase involved in cell wall biosynthesis